MIGPVPAQRLRTMRDLRTLRMGFGFVGLRRPRRLKAHDHTLSHVNHGMMPIVEANQEAGRASRAARSER
jgi:hypothetical protein